MPEYVLQCWYTERVLRCVLLKEQVRIGRECMVKKGSIEDEVNYFKRTFFCGWKLMNRK